MKTNITRSLGYQGYKEAVTPIVFKMLADTGNARWMAEAAEVVTQAFNNADYSSGNGMSSLGTALSDTFYAVASARTGEFQLFRNVEAPFHITDLKG